MKALTPQVLKPEQTIQPHNWEDRPYYHLPQNIKDSVLAHLNAKYPYRSIAAMFGISIGTITNIKRSKQVNDSKLVEHIDSKKIIKLKTLQNKGIDRLHAIFDSETYNPTVIEALATVDRTGQEISKIEAIHSANDYNETIQMKDDLAKLKARREELLKE